MIESENLRLVALDFESLTLLIKDRVLLEKHLDLEFSGHKLSREIHKEINNELKYTIEEVYENPEHFEWYTNWEIILRSRNQSVGSIGLSGMADKKDGSSTISYYIDERFRNKGILSEAIGIFNRWAFTNEQLLQINAFTSRNNMASQKVLQKNGFIAIVDEEDLILWELKRN